MTNFVAPLLSAFAGFAGQQSQNKQIEANNALLKEQYEWQKSKEVPGVTGAQHALGAGRWIDPATGEEVAAGTPGAQWQSQFQPFVNAAGENAAASAGIAREYLKGVPAYQQAGRQGLQGYQNLAAYGPAEQNKLANYYTNQEANAVGIATDQANVEYDKARNLNAREQGRFGALSSQKAREDAFIDQRRTESLQKANERARQIGYDKSQAELLRQQGLAGNLTAAGTSGLSTANTASQLAGASTTAGINAPFQPFNAYGRSIGAQSSSTAPQYAQTNDPFATGAGLGLQAWNVFNPQKG